MNQNHIFVKGQRGSPTWQRIDLFGLRENIKQVDDKRKAADTGGFNNSPFEVMRAEDVKSSS